MGSKRAQGEGLSFHALIPERWKDLVALFGPHGATGGCWCMWFRLSRSEFERRKGEGNKRSLKRIVSKGSPPGILAYLGGTPVGWCAVAPREAYPLLERSRVLKRVDDKPVWSIVCFFVAKNARRKGVTQGLLKAAVEFAVRRGAKIIEGYPVEPRKGGMPDAFAYHGLASTFRAAGFMEVARRSESRPIMRYDVSRQGYGGTGA